MPIRQKIPSFITALLLLAGTALGDGSPDYDASGLAKAKKGDLDGALVDFNKAVGINPDNPSPRFHRGVLKESKGELDGALADYNKVIELAPDDSKAHVNRGNVKQEMGDLSGALADFDKAIGLKADNPLAYISRGDLKKMKGDLDGALADYNRTIELRPKSARGYFNRGCLHYDKQEFTSALVDFRKISELNASLDYAHVYIWLTRSHLGEKESATQELLTYLENYNTAQHDEGALQIFRFLCGQLIESDYLKAAENPDKKKEARQLSQAYFYAGAKRLIDGDKGKAADYFQKCLATGKINSYEYQSAAAELKLLKPQK